MNFFISFSNSIIGVASLLKAYDNPVYSLLVKLSAISVCSCDFRSIVKEVKISIEILTIVMNDLKGRCFAGSSVKLNPENSEDMNPLKLS